MSASLSTRLLLAATSVTAPAMAEAAVIGVVAPQSGPYEILGRQIIDGATLAAEKSGDTLKLVDESCEDGSGPAIAGKLVEEKVEVAIGFLCSQSLDGTMPVLKEARIPAITLSVRWQVLMEDALKRDWPLYRMAPANAAESERIADIILARWPGAALGLIDDGTIHGRELSEAIRNRLEERGMKPVFTDTFRPGQEQQVALVRRLRKTGVTHVFVGGDRNDVAIIARDAKEENMPLTLIGGDAMRAADEPVALQDGVFAVTLPDYTARPDAAAVAAALRPKGIEAEGYVLPAYAAVTLAADAARRAADAGNTIADQLGSGHFATVIGTVAFTPAHELADNPFTLSVWQDGRFTAPEAGTQ